MIIWVFGRLEIMSYFILQQGYELCGWKGLPFALRHPDPFRTEFFDRESYRVVYACDGRTEIHEDDLTEKQRQTLKRLVDSGIARKGDGTQRLEPWQEYKSFPAMYKKLAYWSITGRCNYRCRHCFMSAPDYQGDDLTSEQCVHILDELVACGIRAVDLTGGEPLVSPHFVEILDGLRERNISLRMIYSNGALVDEKLLEELEKRQMHPFFHMSFDGVRWHDWMRGIPGAEENVIRAFRLLHERGYRTSCSMCLHKHNIGDLKENVDLLGSLGVSHLKMNIAAPTGRWKNQQEHFLSQNEANEAIMAYIPQYVADGMPLSVQFSTLIEFSRERRAVILPMAGFSGSEEAGESWACGTVKKTLYISPQGKILPCMTMAATAIENQFDSVFDKSLSEILSDSFYRSTCLRQMRECIEHNEKCRDCHYRTLCGAGCRAAACGDSGTDYLAADQEICYLFRNGWYEKARELGMKYKDSFPTDRDKK